ncbi:hypothetical protein PHYPSEUDO_014151 [Phytophthora pseudosyringae]|uniref:Uncharacterized protein n=1 Tax=Phytophthora pseudosyringae TaxID=221518 RepID=A0A8T1V756_9STRA|nr:hypothetical protein PHYPSEUDO_014151 [Phytophthora pseudosyringae]
MGVELPANLVREYDMLQLLDEDDGATSSPIALPSSPASSLVRELLADWPLSDDTSSSSSSPAQSPKLGEFLLDDELFLNEMEQNDDAVNLPDLDMMLPLSPRANSWLDALPDSPSLSCTTDGELESPLAFETLTQGPVSPLKLTPCDSSSLEAEEDQETELLKREVKYLAAQKEFLGFKQETQRLRRKSVKDRRRGRDVASELKMLLKSQETNQLLNGLAMQQKMYADNFKALLAFAPVNDLRMSLMTPLESYIRLGKDPEERRKTILSLRKEKLDMTHNFIEQKTQGLDCDKPHEFSDMFDKFGKHYCVNFTISRYDGVSIYQVARGIYNQLTEKDASLNEAIGVTAYRESTGTLKCNFMHQRIIATPTQAGTRVVKMPDMESNGVFYCRFGDNSAVLATDYVDRDELHPYDESNRIRKDMSSGVVLTAHEDADGKKYVVTKRYMMAKLHMYPHKVSQNQQDRFFLNMLHSHDNMKRLVVDRVLQHSDAGCSCTGDRTSCCCASDEASIPCGGHGHGRAQISV